MVRWVCWAVCCFGMSVQCRLFWLNAIDAWIECTGWGARRWEDMCIYGMIYLGNGRRWKRLDIACFLWERHKEVIEFDFHWVTSICNLVIWVYLQFIITTLSEGKNGSQGFLIYLLETYWSSRRRDWKGLKGSLQPFTFVAFLLMLYRPEGMDFYNSHAIIESKNIFGFGFIITPNLSTAL